jgi:hypothetical protein
MRIQSACDQAPERLSTTMRIPIIFLFFPLLTNAYTWKFTSPPNQCQNVSIAVEGSGQPPYSLLLVPSGPTPQEVDLLRIQNIPFPGNSDTLSFKLNYPENSTFVAVVNILHIWPNSLNRLLISRGIIHRSATAVGLALAVPALLSLFSNRRTRVATVSLRMFNFGYFILSPLGDSDPLSVVPRGSGGHRLLLMGTLPHYFVIVLPWSWTLTALCHDIHCFAEQSGILALSQVVNPSLSLRVNFPVTLPVRS